MRNYEEKLVDSSRFIADALVEDVGNDPERFKEMLLLTLLDKYPLSMRAARVASMAVERFPELFDMHLDLVIEKLPGIKIDGVKRGFLKIFAEVPPHLNEDQLGLITDLCFTWLDDPKQAMAIRYYSIEILARVCSLYPELKNELSAILEELAKDGSPGLRSRSSSVLDAFKKGKI